MPRAVQFKVASVAGLFRQLDYAPPETRARQMDATERLIADIDPQQNYPEDFIVFRITGYRPDRAEEPVTLVGEALLPDLVNVVLLLSKGLGLHPSHDARRAMTLEQARTRLHVSGKTLQRYRRRGLVCHHVLWPDGVERVSCFDDALERFIAGHRRQVQKASAFTRMNGAVESAIVEGARRLRQTQHMSLNEAARQLAGEHGRAHETIRQLLRRHDRAAAAPIFRDAGPLQEHLIRRIHRAWKFGIDPVAIARRHGKSKSTIHRAVNHRRAELLKSLRISHIRLPTFDLPEAGGVILSAPAATSGLECAWMDSDALAFIELSRRPVHADQSIEVALIAAYNMLKMQASNDIASLGEHPRSRILDQIETTLRWADLIKRRLLQIGLPAALARIEQNLHRPLTQQPTDLVVRLLRRAIDVCSQTIEQVDPGRGQRLDGMVRQAMDRSLAKSAVHDSAGRAAARHPVDEPALPLTSMFMDVSGWEWLSPPRTWRNRLSALDEHPRQAIELRFGWSAQSPKTIATISKAMHMSPIVVVRLLREGEVALRRAETSPFSRCRPL